MKRAPFVLLAACLAGCPTALSPSPEPSAPPSLPQLQEPSEPGVPAAPGETLRAGGSLLNRQLTIRVLSTGGAPVSAGTRVELAGRTLGRGTTDASGAIAFGWLEPGTYIVRIEASGSAVTERTVEVGSTPVVQEVRLADGGRSLRGRVLGPGGALGGAWISCGPVGGWTDGAGRFVLDGVPSGTGSLVLHRGGLADRSVPVEPGGGRDLGDLALSGEANRVSWENPDGPVRLDGAGAPQTVRQAMASVTAGLTAAGWTVGERLESADVRVLVTPTTATLDDATIARLQAFARGGGSLVVLGEWGGAGFHAPEAIARLLHPLGLGLVPDLVRVPGSGARLDDFQVAPLPGPFLLAGAPDRAVRVVTAASVWCPDRAMAVLRAPGTGYRIASGTATGPVLVAALHVGHGRVLVAGDTTAWTTGYEGAVGGTWDNQAFIQRLISW